MSLILISVLGTAHRQFMQRCSMGLLSTIRVLGNLPVIRAPTGGAAEMLARNLFSLLKENISPRGPAHSLFAESLVSDRPRPLLLIFDRNSDIFPLLQHSSTYQALVDDLLDHRLNRVTIEVSGKESAASKAKKRTYDLNTQADAFYHRYAAAPFPEAIEANEKELAEVSEREAEIRSKPAMYDQTAFDPSNSGKDLSEAIESLPEILARKANLEAHTNILQAVMKRIAAREVPTYFEIEQSILSNSRMVDKAAVVSLLKDGSKGKLYDKARLLLLIIVSGDPNMNSKMVQEELDQAFIQGCQAIPPAFDTSSASPAAGATTATAVVGGQVSKEEIDAVLAAGAFLRRLQALQTPLTQRFGSTAGSTASLGSNAIISSLLNTAQSKASSLMAKATSFFTKFNPMFITRIVDNLSEGRSCPEDESFLCLDPRQVDNSPPMVSSGAKYSEVIVFVVGGGCYSEYFNLQELQKLKANSSIGALRNIVYGCSELTSGDKFLIQLEKLASAKK
jgi:sec1 family domain-containing protein 1